MSYKQTFCFLIVLVNMGDNCWVPECGSSRRIEGLYLFKMPCTPRTEGVEWRNSLIAVIKKHRVVDTKLKERIATGKIFTCEKHFKPDEVEFTPTGRKKT